MTSSASASLSALPKRVLGPLTRNLLTEVEDVVVFALPMNIKFRGITQRDGVLLRGPAGWGEVSPFWDYGPKESSRWLAGGLEAALRGVPAALRSEVSVNVTVPVCSPEEALRRLRGQPGATTAKVKVADPGYLTDEDVVRVRAVSQYLRDTYDAAGRVRVDANTAWSVDEAALALERLNVAADPVGGLEYAEQPCATTEELAELRRRTEVPIAADESLRRADDPLLVRRLDAADAAVIKSAPLGGVRPAMRLAAELGLPTAVSSALDSSIGLATGVGLAAALPQLAYASGLNTATLFTADVVDAPLIAEGGRFTAERARAISGGELTKTARGADNTLKDQWAQRLEAMAAAMGLSEWEEGK